MAGKKSIDTLSRKERETADRVLFRRMQREIDDAHWGIWDRFCREYAAINGNRTVTRFHEKFKEAWRRSLLPNTERDDTDADGKYRAA